MTRETHRRRLWRCWIDRPVGRPHTAMGREQSGPPDGSGGHAAVALQAQALCDVLADPRSGITRVVVATPPSLLAALREAAVDCGVETTVTAGTGVLGSARATLRRPGRAGAAESASGSAG